MNPSDASDSDGGNTGGGARPLQVMAAACALSELACKHILWIQLRSKPAPLKVRSHVAAAKPVCEFLGDQEDTAPVLRVFRVLRADRAQVGFKCQMRGKKTAVAICETNKYQPSTRQAPGGGDRLAYQRCTLNVAYLRCL